MSDFKQAVEEILNNPQPCGECRPSDYMECTKSEENCIRDRILSAHNAELDRIAEGMIKMANNPYDGETKYYADIEESPTDIAGSAFSEGQVAQLEKCQVYIQAQKEG